MQIVRHIGDAPPPPPRSAGIPNTCVLICVLVEGCMPGPTTGPACQVARLAPAQAISRGVLLVCCSERSPGAELDPALQQWLAETQGAFGTVLQQLQAWHQVRGEPAAVCPIAPSHWQAPNAAGSAQGRTAGLGYIAGMHKLLGCWLCFTSSL